MKHQTFPKIHLHKSSASCQSPRLGFWWQKVSLGVHCPCILTVAQGQIGNTLEIATPWKVPVQCKSICWSTTIYSIKWTYIFQVCDRWWNLAQRQDYLQHASRYILQANFESLKDKNRELNYWDSEEVGSALRNNFTQSVPCHKHSQIRVKKVLEFYVCTHFFQKFTF